MQEIFLNVSSKKTLESKYLKHLKEIDKKQV